MFGRAPLLAMLLIGCGTSATSADAGRDDAPPIPQDCPSYCRVVIENCTDEHGQYSNLASCLGTCAGIPLGDDSARDGNNLACRIYHASEAPIIGTQHCDEAGAAGNDTCGSNCDGFCTIAMHVCTGANAQFGGSLSACLGECTRIQDAAAYNTMASSGDSLACRTYYLTQAAIDAEHAVTHCPDIAAVSEACR